MTNDKTDFERSEQLMASRRNHASPRCNAVGWAGILGYAVLLSEKAMVITHPFQDPEGYDFIENGRLVEND